MINTRQPLALGAVMAALWLACAGCDQSNFSASPAASPSENDDETTSEDNIDTELDLGQDDDQRRVRDQDSDLDRDDDPDENVEPEWDVVTNDDGLELIIKPGEYELNRTDKCWFAVSGAYFGLHGKASKAMLYQSTFPTPAGGEIRHGATFDTVGGVYLNASDEAYRYGQGEREIDAAIDTTFDSIAVAPGMYVEVRDGNDQILYQGTGPYMALSSDYNEAASHVEEYLRDKRTELAPWMLEHLETLNYNLPHIPLHASRSVKVSKIKDVPCE